MGRKISNQTNKQTQLCYGRQNVSRKSVNQLGNNYIQNYDLGRFNIRYTVGNLVLWRRAKCLTKTKKKVIFTNSRNKKHITYKFNASTIELVDAYKYLAICFATAT